MISIFKMLSRKEKLTLLWVLIISMFSALVTTAGVASVIPLIDVFLNQSSPDGSSGLAKALAIFGAETSALSPEFLGALVVALALSSSALLVLTDLSIHKFGAMVRVRISAKLIEKYFSQQFDYFSATDSSQVNYALINQVEKLVNDVLVPAIGLLSRGTTGLSITVFLFVIDPISTLAMMVAVGCILTVVGYFMFPAIDVLGKEVYHSGLKRMRAFRECINSIREVRVYRRESHFVGKIIDSAMAAVRLQLKLSWMSVMPRHIFEVVGIAALVILLLSLRAGEAASSASAIAKIGAYAFAALRLLPVVQGCFGFATKIRGGLIFAQELQLVMNALEGGAPFSGGSLFEDDGREPLPFCERIEMRGIEFSYQNRKVALRVPSLTIRREEVIGVLGDSGAGKSTFVDLLSGILSPQCGEILVDGVRIVPEDRRRWLKNFGYVPQFPAFLNESVAANIAFTTDLARGDLERVQKAAMLASIHEFITRDLPEGYATFMGENGIAMSGGQRKRIAIARALYFEPRILVLDEATNGLDNETSEKILDEILSLRSNCTIFVISHDMKVLNRCDRLIHVEDGIVWDPASRQKLKVPR